MGDESSLWLNQGFDVRILKNMKLLNGNQKKGWDEKSNFFFYIG